MLIMHRDVKKLQILDGADKQWCYVLENRLLIPGILKRASQENGKEQFSNFWGKSPLIPRSTSSKIFLLGGGGKVGPQQNNF